MRIDVAEVKYADGEALEYKFEESLSDLYEDFPLGGILLLTVRVSYSGDQLFVEGHLEVQSPCVCARCLVSFTGKTKTDFTETFTTTSLHGDEEEGPLSEQAANHLRVKGDYLYLNEYVRQLIILAQDHSPVCKKDCQGLCVKCGINLNEDSCQCLIGDDDVDVRLLKLKEFNFK